MNKSDLSTMSMKEVFTKFAIPSMIGMLAVGLYNLVDAIFVGQLVSSEGVGAIVIAYNITLVNLAFGMMFAMGAMSVLSISIGKKDKKTVDKLFGTVLICVSLLSLSCTIIVQLFAEPLLSMIGAEGEILRLAVQYLKTISIGFIFSALGPALNFLIRGEGNMKTAMQIIIAGMLLNICLDPVLITVFNMGIQGAALATIISQMIVVLLDLLYLRSRKNLQRITKKSFRVHFDVLPTILNVGVSGLMLQIMPAIQMSLMFRVMSLYGDTNSIILMSAAYRVMTFAFLGLWGISQGIQPLIGFCYGAGKFDRMKKFFDFFSKVSLSVSLCIWIVLMLIPDVILSWFISDPSICQLGSNHFRIFMGTFLLYGFIPLSITFFQAIGKGGKAALLTAGRQILFFIPLVLLLPLVSGETGVWLAMPLGDLLVIILSFVLIRKEYRRIDILSRKKTFAVQSD